MGCKICQRCPPEVWVGKNAKTGNCFVGVPHMSVAGFSAIALLVLLRMSKRIPCRIGLALGCIIGQLGLDAKENAMSRKIGSWQAAMQAAWGDEHGGPNRAER